MPHQGHSCYCFSSHSLRYLRTPWTCLALQKTVNHALTAKNETQYNINEHDGDTWTYNHSKLYHVLNLLSASYWYYFKKELLCYIVYYVIEFLSPFALEMMLGDHLPRELLELEFPPLFPNLLPPA